jgi:hypothetical protein
MVVCNVNNVTFDVIKRFINMGFNNLKNYENMACDSSEMNMPFNYFSYLDA